MTEPLAMEVPLDDFEPLALELGCVLERSAARLTLVSPQPGCAMHFCIEGKRARLERIDIKDDPEGDFFREVVGVVLALYSEDLDPSLQPEPPSAALEAAKAWEEYCRLKRSREKRLKFLT